MVHLRTLFGSFFVPWGAPFGLKGSEKNLRTFFEKLQILNRPLRHIIRRVFMQYAKSRQVKTKLAIFSC